MSTEIRPELSKKSKYYIERHRYYELKHFCLQYPIWKKAYHALDGMSKKPLDGVIFPKKVSDPTARVAMAKAYYKERMEMVEDAAKLADATDDKMLAWFLLEAVTTGKTYDKMNAKTPLPYSRDTFYKTYRKFFYILNHSRN